MEKFTLIQLHQNRLINRLILISLLIGSQFSASGAGETTPGSGAKFSLSPKKINVPVAMAGIYTIGGSTPDFQDFQSAITALKQYGISGKVLFKVRNGTYNEQISIPEIIGTTIDSTILFESESGDSSAVVLQFFGNDTANYTLQLNGVDYLTFRKMTVGALSNDYGNVIDIRNSSNHNTLSNCILQGISSNSQIIYSSDSNNEFNHFINNKILNGSYGFYYESYVGQEKGTVVENNILENQYYLAIYCYNQDSLTIRNNTISTNSPYSSYYAIYCGTCNNQLKIEKNKIHAPNGGYGILLTNCESTDLSPGLISNNFIQIEGTETAYGLYLGSSSYQKIYNNTIHIAGAPYNSTGIYIDAGGGESTSGSSPVVNSVNSIDVVNNILANTGGGYALLVYEPDLIDSSDYNDLYTTGTKLAYWSGDNATLNDLQLTSGKDVHSLSQNPLFISNTDLHVREINLNAAGTSLSSIKDDIDGEKRDSLKPDIGADEFNPVQTDAGIYSLENPNMPFSSGNNDVDIILKNHGTDILTTVTIDWTINGVSQTRVNWTGSLGSGDTINIKLGSYTFNPSTEYTIKLWTTLPNGKADLLTINDTIQVGNLYTSLSGTYTLGGSVPDFQNFQDAVTALIQSGIAGNVVFKVRNGTYNEQISIPEITGASTNSTIIFESESGDSSSVLLRFAGTSTANYTLQLNGADYFTFRKISLIGIDNNYGNIIDIGNSSNYNTFSNCIIQSLSNNSQVIYSGNGSNDDYNSFRSNRIVNGGYGFYYFGAANFNLEKGTVIENNIFENQYYRALSFYYQDSLTVRNNKISTNSAYTGYNGINCEYCNNQLKIEKNRLSVLNGGYGILLNSCQGTSSSPGLLSNNFIQLGGTSTAYGIYLYYPSYQNISNNNINITSNSAGSGIALNIYNGINNNLINNILANTGGGYALFNSTPSNIIVSDYNDFYTTGTKLAYWLGDKVTLKDLQSASGKDIHSISQNPLFTSGTDLHVQEIDLNAAGILLSEVRDDIDSEKRDSLKPDIGADEFNPVQTDAGIYSLQSPKTPFLSGNNNVIVVLKNHGADALTSAGIDWTVNGISQTRLNWTGSLASGDTVNVKLGSYTFNPFTAYTIKSWSTLPNGNPDLINTNDTIKTSNLFASLAGIYTLGGATPDFQNFQAAVAALKQGGIAGNVIFKVRNGTYNEQISIPEIIGTSINSTITFESESGDSSSVILRFASTNAANYTLQLNGADYFTFRKISLAALDNNYGNVIDIRNSSSQNTIARCVLQGSAVSSTSSSLSIVYSNGSRDDYNSFRNNRVLNGAYGFYCYGASTSDLERGTVIESNIFENQYYQCLYIYYQDSLTIRNNKISTNSAYTNYFGIYCTYCNNQFKIEKNKLSVPNGGYGFYLNNCLGTNSLRGLVSNNFIQVGGTSTAYGIYPYYSTYQNIYNNTVHVTNTSANNGNAMYIGYSNYYSTIDIVNNIFANTGGGYALNNQYPSTVNLSDYNDLYTTGAKLAYWSGDQATLNDLRSASGKEVHSLSQNPLFNSNTDLHVREIDLNAAGISLSLIKDDIDGEKRDSLKPDIGADEFNPVQTDAGIYSLESPKTPFLSGNNNVIVVLKNHGADDLTSAAIDWTVNSISQTRLNWTGSLASGDTVNVKLGSYTFNPFTAYTIKSWSTLPNGNPDLINTNDTIKANSLFASLAGIYTLGGATPDFQNFQAAVTALKQGGIAGNVVFKVRNGTYNEQISIPEIIGTSNNASVIFESESGDSSTVILRFAGTSTANYTLQLNGADYFTFRKISMAALNSSYGNVIDIRNRSSHNTISHCVLQGSTVSSTSTNLSIVYSNGSRDDYNSFRNNRILNGAYGFYSLGASTSDLEKGTVIEGNTFENQYYQALNFYYQDSLVIRSNKISTNSAYTSYFGIYCTYCNNQFKIEKNKLSVPNGGYGIYLSNCLGTNLLRGLVSNNFIQVGGTNTAYGIYPYYSAYQNIYNNTVHVTNTSANNGNAMYIGYSNYYSTIDIVNNIFANTGGGYALNNQYPSAVNLSDYNDLYTTGAKLAYWSGDQATLNDLRSASGKEAHSLSQNPLFISSTDLHVREIDLNAAGISLSLIKDDIDGEKRDSLMPDIGADEFNPSQTDAGIYSLENPKKPFASGNNDVVVVLKNHGADTITSVAIDWTVNGDQQIRMNWSGSLVSGDTVNVKLGSYLFSPSTLYTIKSWTTLPNGDPDLINTNDTIEASNLLTGLLGVYTIGGTSPDFVDFHAADTALVKAGVLGNVTFKVRNGTYTEQISIPEIKGVSKNSTVTFESESGDSSAVTLRFAGNNTNNYTLQLNGADYFTFRKIRLAALDNNYGNVIDIRNTSTHNTITHCILQGSAVSSSSANLSIVYSNGSRDDYNSFRNNRVLNGAYGFYYFGLSTSALEKGTLIENNVFENQYYQALNFYYQDSLVIRNNKISTNSAYTNYFGIYSTYCNNQLKIEKNKLSVPNGGYGIYLNNCLGTNLLRGLVSNNFIQVGGTSAAYGIYPYYSAYQNIYNNTVHVTNTSASNGNAIYIGYSNYSNTINVVNNIFANTGGGYALNNQYPSAVNLSDYNDLYTTGAKLAYWSGDQATLNDLRSASGKEAHSLSQNPLFISSTDLHVREVNLNAAGTVLSVITDDIDGETRNSLKPDIGADEFTPPLGDAGIYLLENPKKPFASGNNDVIVVLKNHGADTLKTVLIDWTVNGDQQIRMNWSGSLVSGDTVNVKLGSYLFNPTTLYTIKSWTTLPNGNPDLTNTNDTIKVSNLLAGLLGVYTIGGTSPDFVDFHAADTALVKAGVLGNVIFKVRNGTYTEQISIPEIKGVSKNSTVTFESESGDSSAVTLRFAGNNTNNYTLQLNGADYFTFRKISLVALNNSYGNVIDIRNSANHNTFSNCIVQGIANSSQLIHSNSGSKDDYNSFRNNRIVNGSYGFYYQASGSEVEKGTLLENNIFENQYYQALYFYYQDSLIIRNNKISTNSVYSSYYGINCEYCNNLLKIEKNKFSIPGGGYGIYLNNCQGTNSLGGLVSNNFIQVGGTSTAYGIYIYSSTYQDIYNNNINLSSSSLSGTALYVYYGNNYNLVNNILANTGGGYALNNQYPSSVILSDYNDLYTTGTKLAYWSGDKATLNDLRSASGKDLHSISLNPSYQSAVDLHVREITLDKAGTPLAMITDDIDGDPRDPNYPDIGADEFILGTANDAGITSVNHPKTPFTPGSQNVYVTLKNSGADTLKSVTISWKVNNISQSSFQWTGIIPPAASDSISIGLYNFQSSISYSIKAWSENPNGVADTVNYNDTTSVYNLYAALSGIYTIGGISPDFKTFSEAASRLSLAGVTGQVTFNVRPGNYKEQLSLSQITGASALHTIVFQSESGDSTNVVLKDSTTTYVVQLDGTDHITFKHLTIRNNYLNYGKVIEIKNGANYNKFLNNILQGAYSNYNNLGSTVIFSSNSSDSYNQFRNNMIVNGSYGIFLQGINNNQTQTGNVIDNNTFSEQNNYAIQVRYQEGLVITKNRIKTSSTVVSLYGCYLTNCKGPLEITKNTFLLANDGYVLYCDNFTGTSATQGLIANNFLAVGGTLTGYGIYLGNNSYLNVYNNNIQIGNTAQAASALYYNTGANNNIVNNILANSGTGYAINITNLNTIKTSDYNDLYTKGSFLAYNNNKQHMDLAAWKQISNMDLHSLSIDPLFISANDLHVSQIALDSAGYPLSLITDDIDGNPRNQNFPDIGADEFENNKHDIGITEITPASGCMLNTAESVIVTVKNFGAYPETGFDVVYSVDNLQPVTEKVMQSLPPGGSIKYTFNAKTNLSAIRNYSLTAYSKLTGDEKSENDTTISIISNMPRLKIKLTADTLVCPGSTVVVTASGADSYTWSTGSVSSAIYITPYFTTTYTVTATNLFNCKDTETITIHVSPLPEVPMITPAGPVAFCNGHTQVLTSSIGHNISWSTGEKTPSITAHATGSYTVKYTDSLGCSATSLAVQVNEEAAPTITPTHLSVCSNDTISLSVKNAVKFLWSTGDITASIKIVPGTSATYTVAATTALGCTFVLSSTINILPTKTPGQVAGMIPANGAIGLSLPLEVSWLPAQNATNYNLFVWPSDQPRPQAPFASSINSIRFKFLPTMLTYGVTYKWQVISNYHSCESTPGPVQLFMLRHLPDVIVNNVQIPFAAYTGQNIDITWEVKNQGLGNTVHQQWSDRLYMSIDTLNDEFYSLGQVSNMTYLEPGQSYSKTASFTLPKFKDGLFNIFAWADRNNNLLETNDNNNQGRNANPLWIKLTPPPDLHVSSIVTPTDFFSEDTVNVSWTVVNKGKWVTETDTWTDRVYISQDFNNGQRHIIGTFRHTGDTLYPGQSYSTTNPVIIPEAIFGNYFIYVETDIHNNVYEHAYDGNNVSQSDSINVILRPPADLMVDQIEIPQSVTNIESATIKWRVTNIGNSSPRDKNWLDGIYLSKSPNYNFSNAYFFPFQRSKLPSIPLDYTYNSSETIKIPNSIQPGDYYVYVKTDVNNDVFEYLFEENNILRSDTTLKITIAPWPDLQVISLTIPDSAGACETIPVSYTVSNKGTADAKVEWTDKIYISTYYNCPGRTLLKEIKRNSTLQPDSSYTINTNVNLPTGFQLGSTNYCFSVYTDANNTLYEHTSETNNEHIDTLFIKPSDLAVTATQVPAETYSGSPINILWDIKNMGNANSPAVYWRDKIEVVDSLFHSLTGPNENLYWKYGPVKQGVTYTHQNTILIPDGISGNYYIRLTTDLYNENREKITNNNVKLIPIKIILRQPTDLVVSSFNLPANGIAGQPVTMQWNVQNTGPGATLAQGWTDRIYLSQDTIIDGSDILIASYPRSGGLTSGGSYNRSEQVFLPISAVGNYEVIIMTDFPTSYKPYGEEYEHEAENNNTSRSLMTITLAPPSDLIITNVTTPANATTGEPVTISWAVRNLGPNTANGYMTDMVYFSNDSVWDINDAFFGENPVQITLLPNEEKSFSLTTELNGTSVGDYYVLLRTDNKNNIYETNDVNNTLASVTKVTVEVPLLPLYTLKNNVLNNNKGLYYRIEIPDSLQDETLLVTLKGDSINGDNELYLSYDSVPDRSNSGFASTGKPFYGNQEVIVPSLKKGRYYLLVYGNVSSGTAQNISLYAQIINFQVRSVKVNEGGNKGSITVEVGGARFTNNMKLALQTSNKYIAADSIIYVDATKVFVTFNLLDVPLGFYDVVASKINGDTAILTNGFNVVENSPFSLVTSVKAPAVMRLGTIGIISVQFANDGNTDIPTPEFKLISVDGLPISFLKQDLGKGDTQLEFECHEVNGPQNVLRPGAVGTVYIWVKATRAGLTHFKFE